MADEHAGEALKETKFGAWYPVGYVMVAFRHRKDADRACERLVAGGFGPDQVEVADAARIATLASRQLESGSAVTRLLGKGHASEARYLELARDGYVFLLAYAPEDADVERLMTVVRGFDYALADKFEPVSIQHLGDEPAPTHGAEEG